MCASSMTLAFLKLGFVRVNPADLIGSAVNDVCFHSCFQWRLAIACYFDDNTSNDDNNISSGEDSSSTHGSDSKHTRIRDSHDSFHGHSNGHVLLLVMYKYKMTQQYQQQCHNSGKEYSTAHTNHKNIDTSTSEYY